VTKPLEFKPGAYEAIHSSARALFKVGAIDKVTMRDFDESCIVKPDLAADEIKLLREKNQLSQPVFAKRLGTSESTVQKWETGAKRPGGAAMKLLAVVQKHGLSVLD
jgi:putative transcriptional regulator